MTGQPDNDLGEVAAVRVLKQWAAESRVGEPFGPGLGLEEAKDAVWECVEEDAEVRIWGRGVGLDLARSHKTGQLSFGDWDRVLGLTGDALARYAVSDVALRRCARYADEMKQVAIQMLDETGNQYSRWLRDDEFALTVYVLHQVVYLRLNAAGILDNP
ncbi:MAG: hypothetical protein IVW52_16655 [Acidimicrobiales bacterium]|nr:hypothetical protein [Acidimicrobiales bacterium]